MSHNNNTSDIQNEFKSVSQSPTGISISPGAQQSPVSISPTNSAVNSNVATPALFNIPAVSITGTSGMANLTSPSIISPNEIANPAIKSEPTIPSSSMMDIDQEEPAKESTTQEDSEQLRLRTLNEIDAKLDSMENTRLEIVPLLLDIIEQVKTGEISIKDVDNVCGRIRLRLNKLKEDRSIVKSELEKINNQFRCSTDENESTKQHIDLKEKCMSNIVKSIDKMVETD